MGYRQSFTAILAIGVLLFVVEALAQGVSAPAPGPSPSLHDAGLLRSKTLFEYRVKSPQGEDLGKIEQVLVLEKRLLLKKEVRITRRQVDTHVPRRVMLRREEAVGERINREGDESNPGP